MLPAAMAVCAEGAWITVVYVAIWASISGGVPSLGLVAFIAAAASGRWLARHGGFGLLLAASLAGAVVGWLVDAEVRAALGGPTPAEALVLNPGGWLLGLAVWRGGRGIGSEIEGAAGGSPVLTAGLFVLAVPWIVGSRSADAQGFVSEALGPTLVFAAAGILAVGLARLDQLGSDVGADWRDHGAWLGLILGVVTVMMVIALPATLLSGASLATVTRSVLGPGALVGEVLAPLVDTVAGGDGRGSAAVPLIDDPVPDGYFYAFATLFLGLILASLLVLIARAERRRTAVDPDAIAEQHVILLPRIELHLRRPALPTFVRARRTRRPTTASEAYLAALRRLDAQTETARGPGESPLRHARRLRDAGLASAALGRLACDFAIERYGGRPVTPGETHRALRRSIAIEQTAHQD